MSQKPILLHPTALSHNAYPVIVFLLTTISQLHDGRAVSNEARRRCIESSSGSESANKLATVEKCEGEGGRGETAEDMTCIVVMLSDPKDWGGAGERDPTVGGGSEYVVSQNDNVNSNFQASCPSLPPALSLPTRSFRIKSFQNVNTLQSPATLYFFPAFTRSRPKDFSIYEPKDPIRRHGLTHGSFKT
jgi:hypothetical protein